MRSRSLPRFEAILLVGALWAASCGRDAPLEPGPSAPPDPELSALEVQGTSRLPPGVPGRVGGYEVALHPLEVGPAAVRARLAIRRLGPEAPTTWINPFFFAVGHDGGVVVNLVILDTTKAVFRAVWEGEVNGRVRAPGAGGTEAPGWSESQEVRFPLRPGTVPAYLRLGRVRRGTTLLFPLLTLSSVLPVSYTPLPGSLPGWEARLPETAVPPGTPFRLPNGWQSTVQGLEITSRGLPLDDGTSQGPGVGSAWALVRLHLACVAASCAMAPIHLLRPEATSPPLLVGPAPYRWWPGRMWEFLAPASGGTLELAFSTPAAPWTGGWLLFEVGPPDAPLYFFSLPVSSNPSPASGAVHESWDPPSPFLPPPRLRRVPVQPPGGTPGAVAQRLFPD